MKLRFTRESRLLTAAQYENVFSKGKRQQDHYFVVIAAANTADKPRLGLAISKRRAKRAVDRNRIKRVTRECFRHNAASLPNIDIIILARQATATADKGQLHASLSGHWQKLANLPRGNTNHG